MSEKITLYTRNSGIVLAKSSLEKNPQTAEGILNALFLGAQVNKRVDGIYFRIPVNLSEENAQQIVTIGDLGY